jgi:hypothetical protein
MAMRLLVGLKNDMDRGRVLLFPLPNRGPKEDGDREARSIPDSETRAVVRLCMRGSCRLPRLMASSGNGKIVRQEQLGAPTRNSPNRRPVAG